MSDEKNELRQVNWTEVFSFTHIFKSFRMAIHPSKLLLALALITLVWVGGHVLDWFWCVGGVSAYQGEIENYRTTKVSDFAKWKQTLLDNRVDTAAALLVQARTEHRMLGEFSNRLPAALLPAFSERVRKLNEKEKDYKAPDLDEIRKTAKDEGWSDTLGKAEDVRDEILRKIDAALEMDGGAYKAAKKAVEDSTLGKEAKAKQLKDLEEANDRVASILTQYKLDFARQVKMIRGEGVFASLVAYEKLCLREAIAAVCRGDLFTGMNEFRGNQARKALPVATVQWDAFPVPAVQNDPRGFFFYVLMGVGAFCWLVCEHWIFAVLLLVWTLALTALLGGAIYRIAALQFAREEKISILQALRFSAGKFLSFLTAPLIPLAIIFFLGFLLFVGGAVGSIPFVGEILMGALFFLAVILGLLVAFLLTGLVTGLPLMYPTIAVEGSDSFDAMSRSFSYVLTKPWRSALYGLIALMYGAVTYLFVRLFAFVALSATHLFVKWGVFGQGSAIDPAADKLDVIWQAPRFDCLFGPFNWEAMSGTQTIAAVLVGVWVYLVAAGVAAYLVSFFASSTTTVYYLLRRKVDATELDDVYVEEAEEQMPAQTPEAAPAESPADKPAEGEKPQA